MNAIEIRSLTSDEFKKAQEIKKINVGVVLASFSILICLFLVPVVVSLLIKIDNIEQLNKNLSRDYKEIMTRLNVEIMRYPSDVKWSTRQKDTEGI